jgi:hypothetical protein
VGEGVSRLRAREREEEGLAIFGPERAVETREGREKERRGRKWGSFEIAVWSGLRVVIIRVTVSERGYGCPLCFRGRVERKLLNLVKENVKDEDRFSLPLAHPHFVTNAS